MAEFDSMGSARGMNPEHDQDRATPQHRTEEDEPDTSSTEDQPTNESFWSPVFDLLAKISEAFF
jgi:hypothetical protein